MINIVPRLSPETSASQAQLKLLMYKIAKFAMECNDLGGITACVSKNKGIIIPM